MADKKHTVNFDITATDRASQVFRGVKGEVDGLSKSYLALAGAATAALSAGGIAAFLSDAVHYRAALADLAETTGDNVTMLDALARQARISGMDLDRLETSLTKFARNLNAADDEGTAAAQAIEAIGLNIEELRAKKPADAMLDVARALGQFEDGASKVAVAVALMGKEGAKSLPFLHDLAENQDVLGKLTAEEVEQAKRLEQEWRKLKIAFEDGKQALASALIPTIGDLIEQMREGIRIAGGFGAALMTFGLRMAPIGDGQHGARIAEYTRDIESWRNAFNDPGADPEARARAPYEIADLERKREFAKFLQRQEALKLGGDGSLDARDLMARQKGRLDFVPSKGDAARGSSLWTPQDEEMFQARKKAWEESDKIEADFAKEDEQRAKDKAKMWQEVYGEIDAADVRQMETEQAVMKDLEDGAKRGAEAARELGMTFASAFEDAVISGKKFQDILNAIGMDVARIILRKGVTEPAAGAIGGWLKDFLPFAEGGVMTGHGPLPLRRYDAGGVADSPQLAMFGEGRMPEAYVPLPDGRRIPVQMKGGGGHTYIIDARGADRTGLAQLQALIARLDGSIEYRAVAATSRAAAKRGRSTPW